MLINYEHGCLLCDGLSLEISALRINLLTKYYDELLSYSEREPIS